MNVLAVGAHPDDIELGCAGTLLAHRANGDHVSMLVLTDGERGAQGSRSRREEQEKAAELLSATLYWGGYQDSSIDAGPEVVDLIEGIMLDTAADTLYVHVPRDSHQDHRAASTAALAAARRAKRVMLYESPTTQSFCPTIFVDVEGYLDGKLVSLGAHISQLTKDGFVDLEVVEAQARYRGFQARIRYAEAFESMRMVWDVSALELLHRESGTSSLPRNSPTSVIRDHSWGIAARPSAEVQRVR
jgi:LmbE family N-acetylglucosaminyl deacetylase